MFDKDPNSYLFKNLQKMHEVKQDLLEMARVGYTNDNYEIYVNTNDSGKIPHFHYRDKDNWNNFHTCIQLKDAKYFLHGNKQNVLNSKQKKELILFLNKPYNKYMNNWQAILELWNKNNSDVEVDEDLEMPDYKNL